MLDGAAYVRDVHWLGGFGQDFNNGLGDLANAARGRRRFSGRPAGFSEQLLSESIQTRELGGSLLFGKCAD
jgi:hypothetical protein